jgi:transposase
VLRTDAGARGKVLEFLSRQPTCVVALEACATSHYWGREIIRLGHEVRMIPPIYVKPFVKRQKNDAAEAEAIAEAAVRPTMRSVAVKSEQKQALGMAFRARDLLVRQRTQTINALVGTWPSLVLLLLSEPRTLNAFELQSKTRMVSWFLKCLRLRTSF